MTTRRPDNEFDGAQVGITVETAAEKTIAYFADPELYLEWRGKQNTPEAILRGTISAPRVEFQYPRQVEGAIMSNGDFKPGLGMENYYWSHKRDKIKGLTILDPHFSAYDPPAYKMEYWPLLKNTMNQLTEFVRKEEIDFVLWGGDIFHLKSSGRNPTWMITEVIQIMGAFEGAGALNLGIAGNHDIKYGHINEGLKGQPLEVLIEAGCYRLLDQGDVIFWAEGDLQVRIAGASYQHAQAEATRDKKKLGAKYLISTGHFWFGPVTGEFFGEPRKMFDSHGSITRTGAHKHDIERNPKAGLIEIDANEIKMTLIKPKLPPVEEILDLERRQELVREKEDMAEFIETLQDTIMTTFDPKDILDEIAPDKIVKERSLQYIEEAETL